MDGDGPAKADDRALWTRLSKALRAKLGEASTLTGAAGLEHGGEAVAVDEVGKRTRVAPPCFSPTSSSKERLKGLGCLIGCTRPSGHGAGARSAGWIGKYLDD